MQVWIKFISNCVNTTEHIWLQVKINLGIGFVPWGNKPLLDPALAQICMVSLGHSGLTATFTFGAPFTNMV